MVQPTLLEGKYIVLGGHMNVNEYQLSAKATAIYPPNRAMEYLVCGLVSEAGEVAGVHKKYIRDKYTANEYHTRMTDEIGDVLWYVAMLCNEMDINMEEVMENNINKLFDRHKISDYAILEGADKCR
jgi:NTP pyrophosphatase (non-canonical NTP hydrolase)